MTRDELRKKLHGWMLENDVGGDMNSLLALLTEVAADARAEALEAAANECFRVVYEDGLDINAACATRIRALAAKVQP